MLYFSIFNINTNTFIKVPYALKGDIRVFIGIMGRKELDLQRLLAKNKGMFQLDEKAKIVVSKFEEVFGSIVK